MSIAGQTNINIGLPNESANSDSLYLAFNKIQNNFTTLFSNASQVVAGNGIAINTSNTVANISANLLAGNNITIANINTAVQINAVVDRYSTTSLSNIALSLGNRTLIVGTGLSYTIGQEVIVAFDATNYMKGIVSSYNANTGVFTFNATTLVGSTGTFFPEWQINLDGITESGVGLFGVEPGNGILIDGSNVTGAYSGNANISLSTSGVIAGTYKNPNLVIDQFGRITAASNTTAGTVTSVGIVSGGNGLSVAGSPITSNGTITITNTGVTRLIAGTGLTVSGGTGEITIAATQAGYVTNVTVQSNTLTITGSPITAAGIITIEMPNNLIIAGNITANGRFVGNGSGLSALTGSNVQGQVNFASVANSVAAANVSGLGNIALANFDGNASNVLHGDGTFSADITDYGNSNVASYLPTYTGLLAGNGSSISALTFGNITTFNTAGLTTDELYLQSITRLDVSANGVVGYNFDQYGSSNNNPKLYVSSGQTIAFNLNVAGHPFLIQDSSNANYSVGLFHVSTSGTVSSNASAQGKTTGTLYWKVPYGITGNYKYQCSHHTAMNANIVISDANLSNLTISSATTAGTVTTAAQPNITSVGTLTSLAVTGNITAGNVSATTFTGALTGVATSATTAGTVTTAAQPNITSVGTLSSLDVTGNVSAGNVSATTFTGALSGAALSATTAGTVTTAAQPNITSTGTLTSLTSTGNISGANVIATSFHIHSVVTGISANGSTQATATALTKEFNGVSTVSSGQGVILPTAVAGMAIIINNTSANSLLVYPASGAMINSLATNAPYTQATQETLQFVAMSTTQWYIVG